MAIDGCGSCQQGLAQTLASGGQPDPVRRLERGTAVQDAAAPQQQPEATGSIYENRPLPGAAIGSRINISA